MRVTINPTTCIASGNCSYTAPKVFANLDEHGGFVSITDEHPPEAEWAAAREAERLCPSATIHLIDTSPRTGKRVSDGGDENN